jgi:hypothetical protein
MNIMIVVIGKYFLFILFRVFIMFKLFIRFKI